MSDMTTAFDLVTPERVMITVEASMVVVPGRDGLFGALPRHAPMISALRRGVIEIYEGGQITRRIMIDGGIADVTEESCVVLAERAEVIDAARRTEVESRKTKAISAGSDKDVMFLDAVLAEL